MKPPSLFPGINHFSWIGLSLLILCFLLPRPIVAGVGDYQDKIPQIRKLAAETMEKEHLKAVILGIAVAGEELLILAEGNSMQGVPATPDMHFRIGAVSIAYMGNMLLQLVDEGVVSLDDPVGKWLPDLPNADKVTLEMLINCTSGYPDFVPMESFQKAFYADVFRKWTSEELIKTAFQEKVKFAPGTNWNYAHTNFVILGMALAKATGKPFGELMQKRIMEPLGLKATANPDTPEITSPVLHAYTLERGPYEESTFWNPSWTLAEGAIMTSNIRDMLTSAQAIGSGKLLSPQAFKAMLEPRTAGMKHWTDKRYYGLGIVVINGWIAQNPRFHGFEGTMAFLPEKQIAIAIWNTRKANAESVVNSSTVILQQTIAILTPGHPID